MKLNAKSLELESVLWVLARVWTRGLLAARTPIFPSIRTSMRASSLTIRSEADGLELDSSLTVPEMADSSS
jgi:hypothetical protein